MVDLDIININFFKKYLHLRIDQKIVRRGNEIIKNGMAKITQLLITHKPDIKVKLQFLKQ